MKLSLSLFISSFYRLQSGLCGKHTSKQQSFLRVGLAAGFMMTAGASIVQAQVSPEYRTAPRSLITEKVDRSHVVLMDSGISARLGEYEDLGETDGALLLDHIQIMLKRPSERQAAFDAEVDALHTTGSSSFHHWLTPDLVGSEFGPSTSDIATIRGFLESEGFKVDHVGKSGMYIDFAGTVAQVQRTFHAAIHDFKLPNGTVGHSITQQAEIPEAISPAVLGFVSISNLPSAHPMNHKLLPPAQRATAFGAHPLDTVSSAEQDLGPQDFYTIYNEKSLLTQASPINGTGVTVAVLEESAIVPADVVTFRTNYGITPVTPVSFVTLAGYGVNTCTAPGIVSGEEDEATLDIEWAGATAPGANLLFMECASTNTLPGILLSAQAVVENNLADTMSLSYGNYENSGGFYGQDAAFATIWEEAASQGETVVVSAGDNGADTWDGELKTPTYKHGINVSSYSSTAWNVSAGGTDFSDTYNSLIDTGSAFGPTKYWASTNGPGAGSALSYIPETPWNSTCGGSLFNYYYWESQYGTAPPSLASACGDGVAIQTGAGGGGPSAEHARPIWQQSTVYGLPTGTTSRLQPDVSLFASSGWWGHALEYYDTTGGVGTGYAGGTSFVAPQLAGIFALVQQSTSERLGQPNYVMYHMAGTEFGTTSPVTNSCNGSGASGVAETSTSPATNCIFYDIQTGSNDAPCLQNKNGTVANCFNYGPATTYYGILSTSTTSAVPAYATNSGYDEATGIGSINIANMVNAWPLPANLYTPTVTLTIGAASVTTYGTADNLTATISGSGSYPTGSVTFTATPTVGTVGVATILGTAPCSTGGTCVEQATQSIYPAIPANNTAYTITATYSSTNENYVSGVTSSPVTVKIVNKQTPTTAVQNATAATSNPYAILTATITYTGVGAPPSGGMNFSLPTGAVLNGTCTGTTSPLACSVNYPISPATYPVGTYTISASYPGDGNYNAVATKTATLTVNNGTAPTITFTTTTPQYTMYPTVTLTSTSNSTGAKTYSISGTTGTAAATISGSTLTLTGGSGTVTVLLSQAAAGAYLAGSKSSTFTVKAGSIWVGDSTNDVSTFDQSTGTAITASPGLSGGGVGTIPFPQAEAFDSAGDLWIASSNGVSEFTPSASGPVAVSSTPYTVGGITAAAPPLAVAVDGLGVIWVANYNGTISALTNAGAAISPSTGYTASGVNAKYGNVGGIAIDLSGSVWVTNGADGSVTQVLGVAAPVAPISTSLTNGTTGVEP